MQTERFRIVRNQLLADIVPPLPDDFYNVYRIEDDDDFQVAKMNIYHSENRTDIKLRNAGVRLTNDEWDELRSAARILLSEGKKE